MYTYSQLFLGNENLRLPGNIERFFPLLLLLLMFIVSAAITLRGWALAEPEELPASSQRLARGSGITLVVIAVFVAVGLHLPTLVAALRDHPSGAAYLDVSTLFWVVKFYDLGIVVPAALTVGIGLRRVSCGHANLRTRSWARTC